MVQTSENSRHPNIWLRARPGDQRERKYGSGLGPKYGSGLGPVILDFILPSPCQVCGAYNNTTDWGQVCQVCFDTIRRVPAGCSRCGRPHGDEDIQYLVSDFLCGECLLEKRPSIDEARSAIIYEKAARKLICLFKYKGKTRFLKVFTPFIMDTLSEWVNKYDYIVPVPLHVRKHRKRTFNPSLLLADIISGGLAVPVSEYLLIRAEEGVIQAGLSRKERMKAVKGIFTVRDDKAMAGKRILLVDDVFTTGATARECAKVLKKAGANSVYVFTLARTVK